MTARAFYIDDDNVEDDSRIRRHFTSLGDVDDTYFGSLVNNLDSFLTKLDRIEEPPRTSWLAGIERSKVTELLVCMVIFMNCAFMLSDADNEIQNPSASEPVSEWIFQIFYTIELVVKLVVHREYFFVNSEWKLNWFDLILVVSGFVGFYSDALFSGTYLRLLRLIKFGKAMRAVKVMARMRHLRCFLICLQGSASSFFWSLVMLIIIFFMGSLFLMQLVTAHFEETATDLGGDLETFFGSVGISMLTLFKATTGGDDWSLAYSVIAPTGWSSCFVYIIFIAFVQLALINIITGIFVETAVQTLTPDQETVAVEHARREKQNAEDLEHLCLLVDHDSSGKLTPEQFRDGINRGRLPTVLALLGLSQHHVLELFEFLSKDAYKHDEGQVPIRVFVKMCMRLKGPATNFDLQSFRKEFMEKEKAISSGLALIGDRLGRLEVRRLQ
jgi:hypothetical protein